MKEKAAAGSLTKTKAAPGPSADEEDGEEGAEDADAEPDAEPDAEEETSIEDADDSGDADDAAEKPVRRRRLVGALGRLTPTAWVLVVVNLALVGGLVWLFQAKQGSQNEEKASKQVAFAATQAAEDLSSYDFRTIDADLKRATSHTTGKFRDDFAKMTTTVKPSATQGQIVVEGTAVKTAVESVDGDKAIALVYLNQQTAKGTTAERTPNQYTMRMVMKKVGGRWLVSDLQMM